MTQTSFLTQVGIKMTQMDRLARRSVTGLFFTRRDEFDQSAVVRSNRSNGSSSIFWNWCTMDSKKFLRPIQIGPLGHCQSQDQFKKIYEQIKIT